MLCTVYKNCRCDNRYTTETVVGNTIFEYICLCMYFYKLYSDVFVYYVC